MKIEEAMHEFPHSIGKDQTLDLAKHMFAEYNVRHLPVQWGGELVGILSDRDLNYVRAEEDAALEQTKVGDVCTEEPYVVQKGTLLSDVASVMAADKLGCALVLDKHKLVGIFTTVDACRVLAELLKK